MNQRGLDQDGLITREGSLSRVPDTFTPVVAAARAQIATTLGEQRLHSAYLYGSIPRGTAIPGVSDFDLLLALRHEPTDADRADADAIEAALDLAFAQIDGAGILLFSVSTLLSELERHDLGFFVACLCAPLLGEDLATQLPRYRPTSLLARETNGDLGLALARRRERATGAATGTERKSLSLPRPAGRQSIRRSLSPGSVLR